MLRNLLALINDVLDLAKIEAGRTEIIKKPMVIRDWLTSTIHRLQGLADDKNLPLNLEIDERLPESIIGDPDRLRQILTNLVSNAIKFTSEGSVKVSARVQGRDTWALIVSDTGIGIPSHAQEYIFDEFRQVDGSSQRRYGGTGLGLAVVRNLSMMMGGNVRVSSEVGKGSKFTVLLPLSTDVEEDEPIIEELLQV